MPQPLCSLMPEVQVGQRFEWVSDSLKVTVIVKVPWPDVTRRGLACSGGMIATKWQEMDCS